MPICSLFQCHDLRFDPRRNLMFNFSMLPDHFHFHQFDFMNFSSTFNHHFHFHLMSFSSTLNHHFRFHHFHLMSFPSTLNHHFNLDHFNVKILEIKKSLMRFIYSIFFTLKIGLCFYCYLLDPIWIMHFQNQVIRINPNCI
jgi:hypothetical protein